MGEKTLVILQKNESPFRQLVRESLSRKVGVNIFLRHKTPLPETAFGPQDLVLWDISGFSRENLGEAAAELRTKGAGAVILCDSWDESCTQILRQLKVLGFVADPDFGSCLTDALDSAWLLRGCLWRLKTECLGLARRLSEQQIIDEAKWVLVRYKDLTEAEALRRMRRHSRRTNQKLVQVAKIILARYEKKAD